MRPLKRVGAGEHPPEKVLVVFVDVRAPAPAPAAPGAGSR